MKVGVLALQGAFREHRKMLSRCGADAVEIRKPEHLEGLAGVIIPGGESTTIGKLLIDWSLMEPIREMGRRGVPVFGTCAGLILLAKDIVGSTQPRLGLMDVRAVRNAYGRQVDSFEADLQIQEFGEEPFRAVFIRAPYIESVAPGVTVMAETDGKIVMARQGNLLASAFHPELTEDPRVHRYFLEMVSGA
ncbi:glutamine amidotransferase [Clostridiales bacterium PH28_bin88]|nr:glutamine amidotransferase [Clostridiales bacterium PH28_bin88]